MADGVPALAQLCAAITEEDPPEAILEKQVCCNGKVTDHTALLPTRSAGAADLSVLPAPELKLLQLVAHQVLLAVSPPLGTAGDGNHPICGGTRFTVKGTYTTQPGWRRYQPSEGKGAAPADPGAGAGCRTGRGQRGRDKAARPLH